MRTACQTPGAYYNTFISPREVSVSVDLTAAPLSLTQDEMSQLENELHDAMESVIARYFKGAPK